MSKPIKPVTLFFCLILSFSVFSQALYKVSLDERVTRSSLIIEGKVVKQESFRNPAGTMIYTSNTIEVYKVFKGRVEKAEVEVMTVGGQIGNHIIIASHQLSLDKNETGIFFCYPNTINLRSPLTNLPLLDVYSSSQGFLKYDRQTNTASGPLESFASITGELYSLLQNKTSQTYTTKKEWDVNLSETGSPQQITSISGFSPSTVNAGAILSPGSILTINGSGFGTASGLAAVEFNNANDGSSAATLSVAYNSPYMISWTDTQIQLYVPGSSGTGNFEVIDAAGTVTTSPSALNVLFSVQSLVITDGVNYYPKEARLADLDGLGGYTISYNTNIDGTASQSAFHRALTTWKELCGLNITESGTPTSTNAVADDEFNIIMLDNAGTGNPPLASGVLATCYSYYALCNSATVNDQVLKSGFDIVIRQPGFSSGSANFTAGPCPPNSTNFTDVDLETVVLHELGHAINLGHVADSYQGTTQGQFNPGKLMHYAVINSVRRITPDLAAKAGGDYAITAAGISFGGCVNEMTVLSTTIEAKDNCPGTFPATQTPYNAAVTFDLVHSTSDKSVDPNYTQVRCDGLGTDITTNAYYAFRTNNAGGILTLNITGYTTTPAAIASCTSAYGGVEVTGVRLSVYQVSSCPAAQVFPAPIACRTITADGVLADITGLAANTTYLIYAGGIDNTKASFTMNFLGSALQQSIIDFTGNVMDNYNLLKWTLVAGDAKAMFLEKSRTGIEFERIEVTNSLVTKKGQLLDYTPYAGDNYYRLAVENTDGSKEYSKILLLKRNDKLLVNIYPNPVRDILNVQINTQTPGKYIVKLRNSLGQELMSKTTYVNTSRQNVSLSARNMSSGFYHVTVYNEKNQVVKTQTVRVE